MVNDPILNFGAQLLQLEGARLDDLQEVQRAVEADDVAPLLRAMRDALAGGDAAALRRSAAAVVVVRIVAVRERLRFYDGASSAVPRLTLPDWTEGHADPSADALRRDEDELLGTLRTFIEADDERIVYLLADDEPSENGENA